ncbi:MAG TPA: deoxynucleoside kinase [Thermoplasmata archaeon]|jgi:dTMP kinase|nr:deoxynucleoside kinase [Thermoplasmata archaeon]HIH28934.1 deoxynucleoside kinase [Thermoplasmata archaeon]
MRFIIVDGLDGVGKDTHAQLIKQRYETKGEKVIIRSHPESDNFYGRTAKKALLGQGKINQLKASLFYAMDVLYSIRHYYRKPTSDTLIMVRYLMGTAYLPKRLTRTGYHFFEKLVPTSRYMLFLDAKPEELVQRVKQRSSETEMFETQDAFLKVRSKALNLAKGWHIINTSQSVEQTYYEIEKILDRLDTTPAA